jgi:hypothetical protein
MLITFTSKSHPDVVLFGDIAIIFLRAMGASETPPGILRGEEIRQAADKLQQYLRMVLEPANDGAQESKQTGEKLPPSIKLQQRALPLLELLEKAHKKGHDVIWR